MDAQGEAGQIALIDTIMNSESRVNNEQDPRVNQRFNSLRMFSSNIFL